MRVIAGSARGTKLTTLPGEEITRPTIDRVKEAMFSAVQFQLPGANVLDLFAGSGQLGIEALSRGARRCLFCDQDAAAAAVVQANCRAAGVFADSKVVRMEASALLAATKERFDLVLLDPPYRHGILQQILPAVARVTQPGGIVLCESELEAQLPDEVEGLVLQKQYKYGTVRVSRYRKQDEEDEA